MHRAAQEICVFWVGANQDPWGLAIWMYFCLNSGLLFEDRFFILIITSSCQHPEGGRRYSSNVYITACFIESHLASLASELPRLSWQTPFSQRSSYALLSCIQNTAGLRECIATRGTEAHCQVLQSILNCPRYSRHTEIPSKIQKYPARYRKVGRMSFSPLLPLPSPSTNSALALLSFCCCC